MLGGRIFRLSWWSALCATKGRHTLIHLQSRKATFLLQCLQRLLNGSTTFMWQATTCAILHNTEHGTFLKYQVMCNFPGLTNILQKSKTISLGDLVNMAVPDFENTEDIGIYKCFTS